METSSQLRVPLPRWPSSVMLRKQPSSPDPDSPEPLEAFLLNKAVNLQYWSSRSSWAHGCHEVQFESINLPLKRACILRKTLRSWRENFESTYRPVTLCIIYLMSAVAGMSRSKGTLQEFFPSTMWIVEIKPWLSGLAASALTHWTFSPTPAWYFLKYEIQIHHFPALHWKQKICL